MSQLRVARRYAQSLLAEAQQQKVLRAIHGDLQHLKSMLAESDDLRKVFASSIIDAEKKQKIWGSIAKSNFRPLSRKFVSLIIQKRREFFLESILDEFIRLYDEQNKILHVEIASAAPLDKKQVSAIKDKFSKQMDLRLTQVVDETLIGGFILQWSNKILDLSVKHRLNAVKKNILK